MRHPITRSPARRRWLLVLLAPVVVLGVVAMHNLLAPALAAPTAASTSVMAHDAGAYDMGAHEADHAPAAHGDAGHEGSMVGDMTDCGGLLAMCLALVAVAVGWVLWRRRLLLRVLWQRPASTTLRLGTTRQPFQLLTPLQRTTVLRC